MQSHAIDIQALNRPATVEQAAPETSLTVDKLQLFYNRDVQALNAIDLMKVMI